MPNGDVIVVVVDVVLYAHACTCAHVHNLQHKGYAFRVYMYVDHDDVLCGCIHKAVNLHYQRTHRKTIKTRVGRVRAFAWWAVFAVTDHPQGTGLGPRALGGPQLLKYV